MIKFEQISLSDLERQYKMKIEKNKEDFKRDRRSNRIRLTISMSFLIFYFMVIMWSYYSKLTPAWITLLISFFLIVGIVLVIENHLKDCHSDRSFYNMDEELYSEHIRKLWTIAHCTEVLDLELNGQQLMFTISQVGLVTQIFFEKTWVFIRSDIDTAIVDFKNYKTLKINIPYCSLNKPYTTNKYGLLLEGKVNFEFDKNEAKNWIVE